MKAYSCFDNTLWNEVTIKCYVDYDKENGINTNK